MKWIFRVLTIAMLILTALAVSKSTAHAASSGVCPNVGSDTDCGIIITVTNAGATVSLTGQGPYDGGEDTLIGVINKSRFAISGLDLSSVLAPFAFDGDGITTYGISGNVQDSTGYGGPNAYFTNINSSLTSGTVNFITPIATKGGTGYFSLESTITDAVPVVSQPGPLWGGYGAYSPNGSQLYNEIDGSWTVPALTTCGKQEHSREGTWVGLGGFSAPNLEQIGTLAECRNGTISYRAFHEVIKDGHETARNFATVKPGDSIDASVIYLGKGKYRLTLLVNGTTYTDTLPGASDLSSHDAAECIQEDPIKIIHRENYPFADFGSVTFNHCFLVENGNDLPIDSGPFLNVYQLVSRQSNQHPLETLSNFTTTSTDSSFTATWDASN